MKEANQFEITSSIVNVVNYNKTETIGEIINYNEFSR